MKDLVFFDADAIIATGQRTGHAADLSYIRMIKEASGLPIRRLFNTSGMRYRELKVKDRLDAGMTDEEAFELLSSDGMLVKRPVLVTDGFVSFGFREAEWKEALGV